MSFDITTMANTNLLVESRSQCFTFTNMMNQIQLLMTNKIFNCKTHMLVR